MAAVLAMSSITASAGPGTTSDSTVTTSHYIVLAGDAPAGAQVGYRTGCADAQAGVPGLRVLFFGAQEAQGRIRPPGTTSGSPTARVDEATVVAAASGWIRGFTACGPGTAVLALGTNNKSDGGIDGADAGTAWARLVERVATTAPADRVTVAGALDGEPAWSDAAWARGWVDGYLAVSSRTLYTAGSADGCPDNGPGDHCLNDWSVADVFQIATGAGPGVYALPQIYRTDGIQARQWAAISRWGVHNGRGPLRVAGALSQQTACRQKHECVGTNNHPATDNPPNTARGQLADALAGDLGTRVAVPLIATDMAWPEDGGILLSDVVHNAGPDPRDVAGRFGILHVLLETDGEHDAELAVVGRGRLAPVRGHRDVALALNRMLG